MNKLEYIKDTSTGIEVISYENVNISCNLKLIFLQSSGVVPGLSLYKLRFLHQRRRTSPGFRTVLPPQEGNQSDYSDRSHYYRRSYVGYPSE